MTQDELPTTVEELQALLLATHRDAHNARREAGVARQAADELAQTVSLQREQIEKKDRQIIELLQALRGRASAHFGRVRGFGWLALLCVVC